MSAKGTMRILKADPTDAGSLIGSLKLSFESSESGSVGLKALAEASALFF